MNDSTQIPARRQRKGHAKLAIIAVAGLALIGFGAYKWLNKGEEESEYLFASVQTGDIEDLVTASGTLQPRDFVDVGAQVSGQIEEIFVEVGDEVKKGDRLVRIDATTAAARVEANRAQLESSKTSLETQKTNLAKAERDYQRQVNLLAEDATTEETKLNAETTLANARRQVRTSELQIEQQEANMRIEAKNLGYTEISAPIDGTVMSIAVKEGQSVNASQSVPVVLQLADLGTMTVQADVSEADIAKVYKGMNVYFTTLGAGQSRRWTGVLKRIEPKPKSQQGVVLYPAVFDVQNEGGSLWPSATTQVYFIAAEARNVLTVPMAALQQGQQIAREMAVKEREKKGDEKATAPGAARPAAAAVAANVGSGAVSAGSAPATAAPAGPEGAAPAQAGNAPGGNGGGMRANRPGGGFGGQRPGGGPGGGFNGGQGLTPEQIEEMRARFRERGGAGGFGGFGGGAGMASGGTTRQPQQRRGTVMVKLADGTLEPRQVVVGVTDRVHGQVIEGLKEGEEVVVGKRETQPQTSPTATNGNNNNNNNNFRGNQGFPGGGNFRPF